MLAVDEVAHHLSRFTYKPGWTFLLGVDESEGPYVRFVARDLMDSYDTDKTLDIGFSTFLSPNDRLNAEALQTFLRWRLERFESHETREFLKYDGEILFDPHKVER